MFELAHPFKSSPGETLEPLVSSPSALHAAEEIEVVNRLLGKGLSVKARFTRKPFIYDEKKISVELLFSNSAATDDAVFSNIAITDKKLPTGMSLDEFPKIGVLGPGQQQNAYIGIDFCDSLQPAHFTLSCTLNDDNTISHNIQLGCSVGNLLRPCTCSEATFVAMQGKLTGMNENEAKVTLGDNFDMNDVPKLVYTVCNVGFVPSSDHNVFMFAARTVSTGTPVLVMINVTKKKVTVNCEKMVIGSKLVKELKQVLSK